MPANIRLGFDIGGTFTDFVLIDGDSGKNFLGKCLTTPEDPAKGVITGLSALLEQSEIAGGSIDIAIHATTLITNALIERRGAKTALLTSKGFRDVLEMGTEVRYDVYDLFLERPKPLVPRNLRYEVAERLDRDGNVLTPLDVEELEAIAATMRADGIEAVAVTFLHAFRNPAHELRAVEILSRLLPDTTICCSSSVAPEIREYERMNTTAANAYVQPITRAYVDRVIEGLREVSYDRNLLLMNSSGGLSGPETIKTHPIRMLESGPTAGVLAAAYFGRLSKIDSLVTFDMGGTTAKIGLVVDGAVQKGKVFEVGRVARLKKGSGLPVKLPMVELIEIGAGGGSIAGLDHMRLLKVGPRSAGAVPGPACYGRGGDQPTVTDANLLLGYLDAGYFLGGDMPLHVAAAETAMSSKIGEELSLSPIECAKGIFAVVNESMLTAIKVHVAERGEDPRKFVLFAFGGAGPTHAYELARLMQMKGVVVPPGAGVNSAMGLVTAAVSSDHARSLVGRLSQFDWSEIETVFESMRADAVDMMAKAGIDPMVTSVRFRRQMDLRHKGQGHEVLVDLPDHLDTQDAVATISSLFYTAHEKQYGHSHRNLPVELTTCRLIAEAPSPHVNLQRVATGSAVMDDAFKGTRQVYFPELDGFVETPVLDRKALGANFTFNGPAIIEERECTTVVGPSGRITVDDHGLIMITLN